ncbi:MAG: hypothetical protein CL916_04570 [Deltaproteobacteria bacterium]|nr:hypothetical protein [Deltaproteobacteria bacterium]
MFLLLFTGCAFFQAGASQKDFEQAPYKRIYAEKLNSELMGVGDQQLRMQSIEKTKEGLSFQIQSQDMCIKKDTYNELHYSQALGTPMVGPNWELGQIMGWATDVAILGLSYATLGTLREEKEDLRPEIAVGAISLALFGVNAYALSKSSESRYKNKRSEKETLVPCGNWRSEPNIQLTVHHNGSHLTTQDQQISMATITDSWLSFPKEKLILQWKAQSTQYNGNIEGAHTLTPQKEWLCSGLDSEHLSAYLNEQSPQKAFSLSKEISCPKALTQKICNSYTNLVRDATYSISDQGFSTASVPLSTQQIEQYEQKCSVQEVWTKTFIKESQKLIDNRIGLFEISELIEQHDGLLNIEGSAPIKSSFIDYAFTGILDQYDRSIRLYLYPTMSRYNDSKGMKRSVQRRNDQRIRNRLNQDLRSCPELWPSQSAPCLSSYLQFITNRNESRDFYLEEKFLTCTEKDMSLQRLCIAPLNDHAQRYGRRWKQNIQEQWKKSVYKNAKTMLREDSPPAKRINQSLVYLQSWKPELGERWLNGFVQKNIRPEIDGMVNNQIQDKSLASFEVGAKIVENYRSVLGERWANGMRRNIDQQEKNALRSADQQANQKARRLRNSRCSLWQYPKTAACTSRFSGFEECTPNPTINKRVYPDCKPIKIEKCVCP